MGDGEDLTFEKERLPHLSAFLIVCMIWGLSLVVAYDLLGTGIPPFFLVAVTYGIGALALLCAKYVRRAPRITRNELRYGLAVGLVIFAAFSLQTAGLEHTTPAKSGLLTVLYVIFVPLIISAIKKKMSVASLVLAATGFLGVLMMSGIGSESLTFGTGDALTIACAVMFALHFIMLEKYSAGLDTVNFALVQMAAATAAALALSILTENGQYGGMDLAGSWAGLAFMGLIVTGLGFCVQTAVQKKIPATTASVMCCTESVFALIFSWLLGYDLLTMPLLAGAALIILSTVLSSIYGKRELAAQC